MAVISNVLTLPRNFSRAGMHEGNFSDQPTQEGLFHSKEFARFISQTTVAAEKSVLYPLSKKLEIIDPEWKSNTSVVVDVRLAMR